MNGWNKGILGDFITLQRGFDLPEYDRHSGSVPVVTSSGISGFHNEAKAKAPGVAMGRYGTIGAIYFLKEDFWPHNTTLYVKDFKGNDPQFVSYFLRTLNYQAHNDKSSVPGLNRNDLHSIPVIFPSISEQRFIANILGALDDKIELNRRMNVALESMARAVFREMMNNESKGWKTGSILEFANLLSGGTPRTSEESYWNGNIKWVSAKDVGNANGAFLLDTEKKITQLGVDNSSTKLLSEKTTIVTARGTVGAYCMLGKAMTMNQTNYGLKAKAGIGDFFVYFSLSEMVEQLKQQSYGTIFDTITTKTFQSAQCVQPPVDVIHKFDDQVRPLMDAILNNQKESRTLASLRDALLPKLMRGEVRKDME